MSLSNSFYCLSFHVPFPGQRRHLGSRNKQRMLVAVSLTPLENITTNSRITKLFLSLILLLAMKSRKNNFY